MMKRYGVPEEISKNPFRPPQRRSCLKKESSISPVAATGQDAKSDQNFGTGLNAVKVDKLGTS